MPLFILQQKEMHKVKITEKKFIRNVAECTKTIKLGGKY